MKSIKDFFSKCDQIRRKLALWPSGVGICFVYKRFAVQTLLWSLEFVIQINLEYTIAL